MNKRVFGFPGLNSAVDRIRSNFSYWNLSHGHAWDTNHD